MAREVLTGIPMPESNHKVSWVTRGAGLLFTSVGPILPNGTVSTDSIEKQIMLTLSNLKSILEAAGSHCDNILQIVVYLREPGHVRTLDSIYPQYISSPFPNRSTVIVERMVVDDMKIKMVVTALVGDSSV